VAAKGQPWGRKRDRQTSLIPETEQSKGRGEKSKGSKMAALGKKN